MEVDTITIMKEGGMKTCTLTSDTNNPRLPPDTPATAPSTNPTAGAISTAEAVIADGRRREEEDIVLIQKA